MITGIKNQIDRISNEVDEQSSLISQITTALQGKTAGATEDLSTEITTQDTLLSELETVLSNKASGGSSGGGSVETVTAYPSTFTIYCTCYENGTFVAKRITGDTNNVVVGSIAYVSGLNEYCILDGGTVLFYTDEGGVISVDGGDGLSVEGGIPAPDW
jgi:hypothetical protein